MYSYVSLYNLNTGWFFVIPFRYYYYYIETPYVIWCYKLRIAYAENVALIFEKIYIFEIFIYIFYLHPHTNGFVFRFNIDYEKLDFS